MSADERERPLTQANQTATAEGSESPGKGRGSLLGRLVTIAALGAAVIIVAVLLLGNGGGHTYRLIFDTGGQLVTGNEVLVSGYPIGKIDSIELTDDDQAEITITIDEPLHEGTQAVIRSTGLAGVANRYISLTMGPDNAPELDSDDVLSGAATTAPVDLDQLFNAFTPKTRKGLQDVIQGFAANYSGNGPQANRSYKYFSPALSSTSRLLQQIDRDQRVFTQFIVQGGRAMEAIASRRDDLSSLVSNANTALGSIASQNTSFNRALQVLPPTLRQANTTFVNLRAALDDVDPLVNTAKSATENLAPFLRELRPVAERAIPVFRNLSSTVSLEGPDNDLAELVRSLVPLHRRATPASKSGVRALDASQDMIAYARAYSPDLLSAFTKLGQAAGYYDANGHYARVQAAAFNLFRYDPDDDLLKPIPPSEKFNDFDTLPRSTRCPGSATQPIPGSNPFLDEGRLGPSDCDPSDVPPGP